MNKFIYSVCFVLAMIAGQASALILTPADAFTNELLVTPTYNNPDAADVTAIVGSSDPLTLLYKNNNNDTPPEEGDPIYQASYDTAYFNTPTDPSDAIISLSMDAVAVMDADWLIVKGGNLNPDLQVPSWYLFDVSSWSGMEDLELNNFWLEQGAISHVSFFGPGTSVPEPGTLLLFSAGLLGFVFASRRRV